MFKKDIFSDIKKGGRIPYYKLFIGGEWRKSSTNDFIEILEPESNRVFAKVAKASIYDAEDAIEAAETSKEILEEVPLYQRIEILKKVADLIEKYFKDFVEILIKEAGKSISDAESEVKGTVERIRLVELEAKELEDRIIRGDLLKDTYGRYAIVRRRPLGIIVAITPFNYPLFTPTIKIVPSFLAGNSTILKPATDTPISSLMLAKCFQIAGIPKGSLNVLVGRGSEIGEYLVKNKRVNMVTFTGNTETGKQIASICGMKRLQLELGGKAPAIVLEDADLELAAKEIVTGSLKYSGQRCDAISRVLVVDKVADELVKKIVEEVKNWKYKGLKNRETRISPLINQSAYNKVEELVSDAVQKGARIVYSNEKRGLIYPPTVLDYVKPYMKIAIEETFGPIVTIIRVADEEEAIRIAKSSRYALDSCVFTKDVKKGIEIGKKLDEGMVHLNSHPRHGLGLFPYGGNKESGIGREGIKYSLLSMTELQTIVLKEEAI